MPTASPDPTDIALGGGERVPLAGADVDELLAVAHALADAARPVTLRHFRSRDLATTSKPGDGSFDPVTRADQDAESVMRVVLRQRRPDDGIVGEEHGHSRGSSGLTWVIDPIDGTRAYISGMPTWGVLIALFDGAAPVIGIIDQPYTDERFVGVTTGERRSAHLLRGGGRTTLRTRECPDLADATLFTTFPEIGTDQERLAFERVRDRVRLTRYGADCYAYALLASGGVDLVIEAGLQPHDVQALIPVIEGAGGVTSAWDGGPGHLGGRFLAAGSPQLQRAAMQVLADA